MGHAGQMIINEIKKWSLVTFRPHPFRGIDIRVNRKSMGHIHGDNLADLPCYPNPTRIGRKTLPHPSLKVKGMVLLFVKVTIAIPTPHHLQVIN